MWLLIILFFFNFCNGSPSEDNFLNTPELIRKYGYPSEKHEVITEDGYILNHFRIPFGKNNDNVKGKQVVLLQHGVFGSSIHWLYTIPGHSLGYILADEGFDVWLLNTRGNSRSNGHQTLNYEKDEIFWRYSFQEIARYDLSATIDYVLNITQQKKVVHIGHSQGGTTIYCLLSDKPQYNDKISVHIGYAPGLAVPITNPFFAIMSTLERLNLLTMWTNFFGNFDITGLAGGYSMKYIMSLLCKDGMPTQFLCMWYYEILVGPSTQTNKTYLSKIFSDFPSATSARQVIHYLQLLISGRFRYYDQGFAGNMLEYKQAAPPDYNLENTKIPIYIFFGQSDAMISYEGVKKFAEGIPNLKELSDMGKWNHFDFMMGDNASQVLFPKTIEIIKSYK